MSEGKKEKNKDGVFCLHLRGIRLEDTKAYFKVASAKKARNYLPLSMQKNVKIVEYIPHKEIEEDDG